MVRLKKQSGQALPYFMAMLVVLVLCWAMIMNIAKLLHDRMMMQNAADNAAQSVAIYQARVLNVVGYMNYKIAEAIAGGAFPVLTPIKLYNQQYVGHADDSICKKPSGLFAYSTHEESSHVSGLRNLITGLAMAQQSVIDAYPVDAQFIANDIASRQEYNSSKETTGADLAMVVPATIGGIKKNNQSIKYFSTIVYEVNWVSVSGLSLKKKHAHIFLPGKGFNDPWREDNMSWYYIDDKDAFSKRKVTVMAIKKGNSDSNKGYPLMGNLFGLTGWPEITTKASAAVYNPRGPMFPLVRDDSTGIGLSDIPLAAVGLEQSLQDMSDKAAQVADIPYIGPVLAGIVGTMAAAISGVAGISVANALSSDETPIKRYNQVSNPDNKIQIAPNCEQLYGWEAHLVPVGSGMIH